LNNLFLQSALSGKFADRDDFRKLTLTSDNEAEIIFHRDNTGEMVYESNDLETLVPEDSVFEKIEEFIQQGFKSLTCESWSGDIHINTDAKGKMKIEYSQPVILPGVDETKHLIDPEEASHLLSAIEIAGFDGSIKADMRRKFIQIDNFVKLIKPMLTKSTQEGKISILDCGCGKSYLSFVMNYFIREKLRRSCHFFCIDTSNDIIQKCLQIRGELGYDNMDFSVSQIRDFQPGEKVDIVCSLHACDIASDEAIAKGIRLKAPFLLVVPCCQHEVINQLRDHPLKAINRHGVYKSKLADLLTDAMRTLVLEAAGYKVRVTEYVSPTYTPKNIMIQAEKVQSRNKMAMEQYMELKAMFGNISIELERLLPELFAS